MYARTALLPAYKRSHLRAIPRAGAAAEQVLLAETNDMHTLDYSVDDVRAPNGTSVTSWPARRGGLTATSAGTPTFTVADATVPTDSITYNAAGNAHKTTGTVDWSSYKTATLLSVAYTTTGAGAVARGSCSLVKTGETYVTNGGISQYYYNDQLRSLHTASGAAIVYEAEGTTDAGTLEVIVSIHDTSAAANDEIQLFKNGVEEVATQVGSSASAVWFNSMYVVIGQRGHSNTGLNGRLARAIMTPKKLSVDAAKRCSFALMVLTKVV